MPEDNTPEKVIDIQRGRVKRNAEERRQRNEKFAELILSRWDDTDASGGRALFNAILRKAINGPIVTRERAAVLLPILLEVLDEMDLQEGSDNAEK
ncbi:MAG TPA: hypothetical protein VGJ37_18505 [Pyrinomonadaceae bacterium]|jgi:hypothetical protein